LRAAAVALALLVPLGEAPSAAQTIDSGFPAEIDPYQPRDPQRICDPGPKPGVVDFANLLLASYPASGSSGISRDCGVRGTSEHKEGRAFDWAVSVSNPEQRAAAENALSALLATDEHGNTHAYFRRFGLMYIIWNGQIFSASHPEAGWRPYACNPSASYDSCHVRHVHFSFSRAGAQRQTSWWTVGPPAQPKGQDSGDTASEAADDVVERIAGDREIDTAVELSRQAFPAGASAEQVFIADAGSPHDAIVASVMAGAFHGSVLLTGADDEIEEPVDAEIARLLGDDAPQSQVTFVGDSDALPDDLLDPYRDRYEVRRIAGDDVVGTARTAAEEVADHSRQNSAVVIGTSGVLDALPMVAVAAANDWPVVFTDVDELPSDTRAFLVANDISHVHIAGPDTAVSEAVANELGDVLHKTVERHSGANRYDAAVNVAERFFALPSAYAVASGRDWPDAVVGATYAGERRHAPMLLTGGKKLDDDVLAYIKRSRSPDSRGVIIGGDVVVEPKVARQLRKRLE
jgi:putative cell wall-binding protein